MKIARTTRRPSARARVVGDVLERRREQDERWSFDTWRTCSDGDRLAVLTEELGEVAAELAAGLDRRVAGAGDVDHDRLRQELLDLTAVGFKWLELLEETA